MPFSQGTAPRRDAPFASDEPGNPRTRPARDTRRRMHVQPGKAACPAGKAQATWEPRPRQPHACRHSCRGIARAADAERSLLSVRSDPTEKKYCARACSAGEEHARWPSAASFLLCRGATTHAVLDASSQRSLVRGNVDCWQTLQPQVGERLENRTKRWRCGCLRAAGDMPFCRGRAEQIRAFLQRSALLQQLGGGGSKKR